MSSTISENQVKSLRNEFKTYLRETYPMWKDTTVSTFGTDAFFALNNNVGIDFWASFTSEESLLETRDKIRDYFVGKGYGNSNERANGYLPALRQLKTFLDTKHPAIPAEWSGKSISVANLKSEFQQWMRKQKKSNGESYSRNTISSYTSALKNATLKLELDDSVCSDLFSYTSFEDFEVARKIICDAPNFNEIDIAAANKAYSNGMILYARFLKELGEPTAWIFQGNPKYYDVVSAVETNDTMTWAVNQHTKEIKKDDRAYIWLSGSEGGIIASGKIIGDPEVREPKKSDPYNRGDVLKDAPYLAVDIQIERRLVTERISRALLMADERTKQLSILSYPNSTNFRVTKIQEEVIESIISGFYERVPVVERLDTDVVCARRYWLYSPGEQGRLWEEFYEGGIMGIGWDELGDLMQFESKESIKTAMRQKYDADKSYRNDGHSVWQFAKDIEVGDIVFVKKGKSTILGRGSVESDCIFDNVRSEYKNIRKVKWTHRGEWENPDQHPQKVLTDITSRTGDVEKLESLIFGDIESSEIDDEPEIQFPEYNKSDFLDDVFISLEKYETLKDLLLRKKNIILQGAPGVGKTYAAQRLAFSIMGAKDTNRVKVIQFHQSYSYEDFIMGYRPDGSGFRLAEGPFYKFCKMAEIDNERPYFFIIDEINRGNLSKIFGELLMLVEGDKRNKKDAMRLLYKDEQFHVPENVHIIGMMNTADRSLAMIDYALRRRFAFFDMEPAFQSDRFKEWQTEIQNPKFDALISKVEKLNEEISKDISLGIGFRIGHSYFCTNDVVDEKWLNAVIEYELVPLLNEYWFDEPLKVESWSAQLRSAVNGRYQN